jgi:hypothetical protein
MGHCVKLNAFVCCVTISQINDIVVIILLGEAPVDPRVGFLPPNNGTTGQGFVTFTVFADDDASNLATIDAEASIIFDANEPINTPPIFNTVMNVWYYASTKIDLSIV